MNKRLSIIALFVLCFLFNGAIMAHPGGVMHDMTHGHGNAVLVAVAVIFVVLVIAVRKQMVDTKHHH